ncbi:unnamed protein product [Hydatigera taeniaeformis]|uniref:BSD domain-containing protein n=1 Tax=Hydatigena taeniaeformis TaxID=6205 RepID=A0A0R3WUZ1_HYDTA|nr:unnamed protein product [Hydatigera taeniaeformis]
MDKPFVYFAHLKENLTKAPPKQLSRQSLTADSNDVGDDQWQDWASDTEDGQLSAEASSLLSLKSSKSISRPENELGAGVAQVKVVLTEFESEITSYPAVSSIPQGGDLLPTTPLPSANGSLRYTTENAFSDVNTEEDDVSGWSVEDDEF